MKTKEQIQDELFSAVQMMSEYWAETELRPERDTVRQRMDGLVHSIFCIFDGVSASMPGFKVMVDNASMDEDSNEYPKDLDIAGDLHEGYDSRYAVNS